MRLKNVWLETPKWLRTATLVSFAISAVLFVVGVIADALNWSPSEWGYFVNLYSSVTAFFVAVPIALIGLDAIAKEREQSAGREQTRRLTQAAWNPIVVDVLKLTTEDLTKKPLEAVQKFIAAWSKVPTAIQDYAVDGRENPLTYDEMKARLEDCVIEIESAFEDLKTAVGNRGVINHRWISIKSNLELLMTLVRERRLGYDMPWLEPIEESKLRFYFLKESSPLSLVMELWQRDENGNSFNGLKSMPNRIRRLATLQDKKALIRQFNSLNDELPVTLFSDRAIASKSSLQGMREIVQRVDASDFAM
ncbi:hypothetical protein [Rhodococcoides kyotonense]|uniref:hypothetical protein n=1 Tax=Rhodococcoides kyotonense TaxID=398843 RepID=UPI000B76F098|nr:hypothetical protein [Rhodococcus kyotonensis]